MINKTTDYGQFKFRADNREGGVNRSHVEKLKSSIRSKNMLELVPILVNSDMEIIDGQHRLTAAKELGLPIYYKVQHDLEAKDIILMNITKPWGMADFFNFHIKNHKEEYIKLDKFIKEHGLKFRVAFRMICGHTDEATHKFKTGEYVHDIKHIQNEWDNIWWTINSIRRLNGGSKNYLTSGKFWTALYKLLNHEDFDMEKWKENLERLSDKIGPRASLEDYKRSLMNVYNWRNRNKIDIIEDEREYD